MTNTPPARVNSTKLSAQGYFQAIGRLTDIEPFWRGLTEFLIREESQT